MRALPFSFLFLVIFTGCLEVAGDGNNFDLIPDINVACASITCPSSPSVVFVGYVKDLSVSCEDYFLSLFTGNYYQSFDAWGETTASTVGPELFGTVTTWYNFNGGAIGQMTAGRYTLCGHYDANDNQTLDAGEAVGDMDIYLGTSPQELTNWVNF